MSRLDARILKDSSSDHLLERLIRTENTREIAQRLATRRFGPAPEEASARLASIDELDRLDALAVAVSTAQSRDDLLGTADPS
ncbi:hypothetical protein OJF2_02260 [Aquisphaera giovannonii]|uniref:DUF4351 domain-containing protein n=1 Tax=Aquisphaera giovannonii TaxID=406548 RepID=A0A5B9VV96_9BACT|nr:hypothetical protein [Aquisphaera giovannonii]QEH31761.1 hypothetical protein OJF2_02260 [Aquisphaera giovannonii]